MNEMLSRYGDLDIPEFTIRKGRVEVHHTMQPKEAPRGTSFVDQLSFTFLDDVHKAKPVRDYLKSLGVVRNPIEDKDVITNQVDAILNHVFGLRVGDKRLSGLNFYHHTWNLVEKAGMVSIGGQAGTILVQITGHGLACARQGWQERLAEFAKAATRFVITRCDLAYDDHDGQQYSTARALQDYQEGRFTARGRPPSCEQRGNWIRPDGKGLSFYVGKRENGKMLRVYEKGRQLGDTESEWVRVELELHNKDRYIPFDVIERPECYLAGAYSALEWVCDADQVERIATLRKVAMISYETLVGHMRRSYGGLIKVMLTCEEAVLDRLAALAENRPVPMRLDLALSPLAPA